MFTASTWTAPSDLADRLAATLVATAAMSTSPLMRALETSLIVRLHGGGVDGGSRLTVGDGRG